MALINGTEMEYTIPTSVTITVALPAHFMTATYIYMETMIYEGFITGTVIASLAGITIRSSGIIIYITNLSQSVS